MIDFKDVSKVVGGIAIGTAGLKILLSKDAKCVYTYVTAAALRAKDCIIKTGTTLKENCDDIYADATDMNTERAAEEELKAVENARAVIAAYEEKVANDSADDSCEA